MMIAFAVSRSISHSKESFPVKPHCSITMGLNKNLAKGKICY